MLVEKFFPETACRLTADHCQGWSLEEQQHLGNKQRIMSAVRKRGLQQHSGDRCINSCRIQGSRDFVKKKKKKEVERLRMREGEGRGQMAGWHHRLSGRKFEQTQGYPEGQGSLAAAVHGVAASRTWLSDWTTAAAAEEDTADTFSQQNFTGKTSRSSVPETEVTCQARDLCQVFR